MKRNGARVSPCTPLVLYVLCKLNDDDDDDDDYRTLQTDNMVFKEKTFIHSFIHSFISLLPTNVKRHSPLHMTKTYYDYVTR